MQQSPNQPPSGRTRWRFPRVAVTFGLASFLGMAGAGVALAASGGGAVSHVSAGGGSLAAATTPTTVAGRATTVPEGKEPHGFPRGGRGHFGPGGPMGPVVHGIYTVETGNGYKTVEVQVGKVDSVTSSAISVTSADGYQHSYQVQPSTVVDAQANGIATVAKGDEVRVEGLQQSGGDVATDIADTTKIGASRDGFGFKHRPEPGASSPTTLKAQ